MNPIRAMFLDILSGKIQLLMRMENPGFEIKY